MTPGAQAAAAISILSDWDSSPKTIETIMRQWGQKNRFAGSSDRAAIGEIVFDVMRNRARYAAKMKSSEPRALVIGHLSEVFAGTDWQDRFGDGPYAASEVTDEELDLGNRVQDGQDLVTCMSVPGKPSAAS